MAFEDYTSFDDENWNGWQTGSGATPGHGRLVRDKDSNIYWAGLVDMGSVEQFEPALRKAYMVVPSQKIIQVRFQYRIKKAPEPGQHFLIGVTSPSFPASRFSTSVDNDTPINRWLDSTVGGAPLFSGAKEIWIGLWRGGGTINPPQWAIEFDNIRVTERA
ncbi:MULTISPECIES: hypothetical protein [unclassified Pseudomonas]|uniref:hypothetical protein n=1 Tax=unclassified Pseudomonas TaxID=196821 RepID=UPI0039B730D7